MRPPAFPPPRRLQYPHYYTVIPRPISLADTLEFIQSRKYSLDEMHRDLRRMLANARKYNTAGSAIVEAANKLEKSIRKCVKEITKEAESFEDEDFL